MTYIVLGGAGFIGSHLVGELAAAEPQAAIRVFDNFSSGRDWHLASVADNPNVRVIRGDIKDADALKQAMAGADVVYHFASNPDIAKAVTQPDVDFWEGTYLTNNVVEAMRVNGVRRILYASGSGVYGDTGTAEADENWTPMTPISTYGASKLACEALLCAYCHMFDLTATAFRFANVVGPRQTHGVGYDFLRRLIEKPAELFSLGDGTQSKSYIHVSDVIAAMRVAQARLHAGFAVFNVATGDCITVTEIADIVAGIAGATGVAYRYAGGSRGWKGDVPIVRLNSDRIRALGWASRYSSRQAIEASVRSMLADVQAGRL